MPISVKEVFDWTSKAFSFAKSRDQKKAQDKHNREKQEFLMAMVTAARQHRGNAFKPMPGTREFEICEELAHDGFLDRDIISGHYILKGPGHMAAYGRSDQHLY